MDRKNQYYCNPININYRYQFNLDVQTGKISVNREAADPSMICFHGRYYIFASMTLGVWVSDNLADWENHRLPGNLPLYDYAPDVRVIGDYIYFSASKAGEACSFYRTKDILNGPYEEIPGTFPFWDPNLFLDEDGSVYFYWGCSNETPIYGVQLDPKTMLPLGEKKALIYGNPFEIGYERIGENNSLLPRSEEEVDQAVREFVKKTGGNPEEIPEETLPILRGMFSQKPYIEGAWMDKHDGKYYLQYAAPGTEYATYANGVYVSNHPLGPFTLAKNNPYSFHPGGFMPGAGHGSTMKDLQGDYWHAATMRISVHHPFERRVGIWRAGFDADGELFCNQRFGDWPAKVGGMAQDIWEKPEWMLLSYGKTVTASSFREGKEPELAVNENAQNWWQADSNQAGEWLMVDLGQGFDVHGIQVNFADDEIDIPVPGEIRGDTQPKYIEEAELYTRFLLEGSLDGTEFFGIVDKSAAGTDFSHDFIVLEEGKKCRYVRLIIFEVPYSQAACISGLRIFGKGRGKAPEKAVFHAGRSGHLDMSVSMKSKGASGYLVLWGNSPEKLYHSCMTYEDSIRVGALVKGQDYYVRVDSFNEFGITEGENVVFLPDDA